jgi:flagellar M-ring protein FliF
MGKLSEIFNKIIDKIKSMTIGKRIAFGLLLLGLILFFVVLGSYRSANKYGVLFANLDAEDGRFVHEQLQSKKIDTRIKGSTIYVPRSQVDQLRLELASSLTNGSKGYELLDSGNNFGMTDEEFKIRKQRSMQGELERTIKSFPQIEAARVHLTPAQDSPFVRDRKPGQASVYLQLRPGSKLSTEQVRAIVALISGSVENLPMESVQVIDNSLTLISQGIFDNDTGNNSFFPGNQQTIEREFEAKLEAALLDMLETVLGRNKVAVKVNADLDFDAKETSEIVYDPNSVEVSTHIIRESTSFGGDRNAQSPVDDNMNNTTPEEDDGDTTVTREEETRNYNVGRKETRIISAPGEVKRLTASVIVDGVLSEAAQTEISRAVAAAIGTRIDRGDEISVIGMTFDQTENLRAREEFEALKNQLANEQRMSLYRNIAYAVLAFIGFIALIVILKKLFRPRQQLAAAGIDVVIGDDIAPKERIQYPPLELEKEDEKSHVEKEIKKYAMDKPEQVADIIKSWLTEDER